MQWLYFVIGIIFGWIIKSFFPSYFKEKGKNMATKEDIAEITNEVEKTRNTYLKDIEELRAELQIHIGHREEKRKAYARICSILHNIYLSYTNYVEKHIQDYEKNEIPSISEETIKAKKDTLYKFEELEKIVIEESLYLKPEIIQELFDLGQSDIKEKLEKTLDAWIDIEEAKKFILDEGKKFWTRSKDIMDQIRKDQDLDSYPNNILEFTRYFDKNRL